MAISALTLNGVPQIDLRQDTINENTAAEGATGHKNDGSSFTGEITSRTASDLTASGATVTVPAGLYSTQATKSVATTTHPDPTVSINSSTGLITASHTQTAGYVSAGTTTATSQLTIQAAATITPSTSQQTAVAAGRYTTGAVVVSAMPTGTAGTPTATKGTVSNHSVTVTPSVTNTAGYITGGTKTGTGVSVSASELVSGDLPISQNGNNIDVTNYETVSVNVAGSTGKNVQAYRGYATTTATSYTATTVTITVAKTGTYNVSWMGYRNTNTGTSGSQLYRTRNGTATAIGTASTTFVNTYGHSVSLANQSFNEGDILVVRARARSASYVMGVGNLIIEEV